MEKKKISLVAYIVTLVIMLAIISLLLVVIFKQDTEKENTENMAVNEQSSAQVEEQLNSSTDKKNVKEKLSKKQLNDFTKYFNETENNGFLLSSYKNVKDIDLNAVLYNGAGFAKKISDNEQIEVFGELQHLDILEFKPKDTIDFLKEKTDYTYDLKKKLNFTYKEKYDRYYLEKGDTNYNEVKCTSGYKEEDMYTIEGTYNELYKKFTVTLKLVNGKYKFVSNIIEK